MSAPASPGQPSREEFARLMADRYRAGGGAELDYDAADFSLRRGGEPRLFFYLGAAYREYCAASPEGRAGVVERYAGVWLAGDEQLDPGLAEALPNLLPVLRAREYFELSRLRFHSGGELPPPFPYRVVGKHYALGLMVVAGQAMRVVAEHHLDEWKAGLDDLLPTATQNLRARSEEPLEELAEGRLWLGHWQDNFGPSRLLFLDRIRACAVRGDPVVLPPDRDMLLLTGSDDPEGLLALANAAEAAAEKPHPVGCLPLRLAGDEWVPFLPPEEHPAGEKFRELWYRSHQRACEEQAGYLRALVAARGEAVEVEACHYHPPGEVAPPFTFCVWSQGADALLPRAGQVLFALPDDRGELMVRAQVSWERARQIVGDLMEPLDHYPERWRVRAFPDAGRLAALREASGT